MLTEAEWNAVVTSLKVATASVALGLPFAIGLGYFLARWRSAGKWLVETVVNLPLVLPPVVTGYLLLLLMGRNGPLGRLLDEFLGWRVVFTWYGAVAAGAIVSFPLMVRTIQVSFRSVDTRLEEAARSLGRSRLSTFYRVSLPLALWGIVAGSVLGFARTLGEFGATIMVAGNIPGQTQTIPTAIYSLVQSPGGVERSTRLLVVSILLACVTLAASEILIRRRERHALS
jgi:molybdate transport system permease protein